MGGSASGMFWLDTVALPCLRHEFAHVSHYQAHREALACGDGQSSMAAQIQWARITVTFKDLVGMGSGSIWHQAAPQPAPAFSWRTRSVLSACRPSATIRILLRACPPFATCRSSGFRRGIPPPGTPLSQGRAPAPWRAPPRNGVVAATAALPRERSSASHTNRLLDRLFRFKASFIRQTSRTARPALSGPVCLRRLAPQGGQGLLVGALG